MRQSIAKNDIYDKEFNEEYYTLIFSKTRNPSQYISYALEYECLLKSCQWELNALKTN